jgi:hypothetical protein
MSEALEHTRRTEATEMGPDTEVALHAASSENLIPFAEIQRGKSEHEKIEQDQLDQDEIALRRITNLGPVIKTLRDEYLERRAS